MKKSQRQKQYYLGLSILKVFLAFDVIRSHNFKITSTNNKIILSLSSFIFGIIIILNYFFLVVI